MMEQRVHERASSSAGSTVNNHPRRLIYDDHVFVFIEHVEWDLLRSRTQRGTRKDFDFDDVSGNDSLCSPHQPFADAHVPLLDQLLYPSPAEIGKARCEIEVEATACVLRRYRESTQDSLRGRKSSVRFRTGLCLHDSHRSKAQK